VSPKVPQENQMDWNRLNGWIQLGANIGIVAGLVLVWMQINQNSELARASLFSEHQNGWMEIDQSLQSENFAQVLQKAIEEPENLSTSEMLEMRGYIYPHMDQFARTLVLYQLGVFKNDPTETIGEAVADVFGNRYSQAWWTENRANWNPELVKIIDDRLLEIAFDSELQNLNRIRARISSPSN
jgi:hypothetical protein